MVYFINRMAHWILWQGQSVNMRQLGAKRKKKRADICQKATCAKWEMRTRSEKQQAG